MTPDSIELLERGALELGVFLEQNQLEAFNRFAAELQKWSKKINLTSITSEREIVVKHFLDSLSVMKVIGAEGRLADIGAGAGFPSIPLKIAARELSVVAIDAVAKKVMFQRHVARLLLFQDFQAIHARGEDMAVPPYSETFDWVLSRAFSDLPTFVNIALPLVSPTGVMVAMKGRGGDDEAKAAAPFLVKRGVRIVDMIKMRLPVSGDSRSLIIMGRN